MKMRAAVVRHKKGPFLIEEVKLDVPQDNEVLVRIAGTGLCHTDLAGRDQDFPASVPIVLGHEHAIRLYKVHISTYQRLLWCGFFAEAPSGPYLI
jgi:aryl-alcohol dehydrogenase